MTDRIKTTVRRICVTRVLKDGAAGFGFMLGRENEGGVYIPNSIVRAVQPKPGSLWDAMVEPSKMPNVQNPWVCFALTALKSEDGFPDQVFLTPDGEGDFVWDDELPARGESAARYVRIG